MSIDSCAELVATKAPAFFRGVMMADVEKRPVMLAILALDIELWTASKASNEDMVNAIKVAWWAEAVDRLPDRSEDHPVLEGLVEASAPIDVAKQMATAFQEGRESLPIIVRAFADYLGADGEELIDLIHKVADKSHKSRKWPEPARPIVAMIAPLTRWGALKLTLLGRA